MTKKELVHIIIENFVDEDGNINLSGLDFSEYKGDVILNGLKSGGSIYEIHQSAEKDIVQYCQTARKNIMQVCQMAGKEINQIGQIPYLSSKSLDLMTGKIKIDEPY